MGTHFHQSFSKVKRFGRGLGRFWRWLLRVDGWMTAWLMQQGMPRGAATAMLWLVRLAALGLLMYAALWLAVLVMLAVIAAWAGDKAPLVQNDESDT